MVFIFRSFERMESRCDSLILKLWCLIKAGGIFLAFLRNNYPENSVRGSLYERGGKGRGESLLEVFRAEDSCFVASHGKDHLVANPL